MIGMGIGRRRAPRSAATPAQVAAAFAATLAVFDWANPATMTAGDGGVVVQGASDTIATVPNAKTPGTYNLVQATGAQQPVYNNGAVMDGTDDRLGMTISHANCTIYAVYKGTDTVGVLFGSNLAFDMCDWNSASGSTAICDSGTLFVAGVSLAGQSKLALYNAIATGAAKVVKISGANLSTITTLNLGGTTVFAAGTMILVGVLNNGAADYAAAAAYFEGTLIPAQIAALGL